MKYNKHIMQCTTFTDMHAVAFIMEFSLAFNLDDSFQWTLDALFIYLFTCDHQVLVYPEHLTLTKL